MSPEEAASIIPLVEEVVERITSDFHDNVIVTVDDTALSVFAKTRVSAFLPE